MDITDILTTVKGREIRVADVLVVLKAKGIFRQAIYELIEKNVIKIKCEEGRIDLPDDEFTRKRDEKRMMMGLADPVAFQNYLRANGITLDQWGDVVRFEILSEKLKEKVVGDSDVEAFYKAQKGRYTTASVARLVCQSKDKVDEAARVIRNGEKDFAVVAATCSIDQTTRASGGYMGNIRRGMLHPEVEPQVFDAVPESLLGPFEENGLWTLYKVYAVTLPGLTDSVKAMIRDQMFKDWLRREVQTIPA